MFEINGSKHFLTPSILAKFETKLAKIMAVIDAFLNIDGCNCIHMIPISEALHHVTILHLDGQCSVHIYEISTMLIV